MDLVAFFAGLAAVLFCLHRLFTWAEEHGWIYYRDRHGSGTGNVMNALDEIYNPSRRHQREYVVSLEDFQDQEADGAPPELPAGPRTPDRIHGEAP